MCTADSKFIRKLCTANSYKLLPTMKLNCFFGYFLIIELVQNVISLTIKQIVCQKKTNCKVMEVNAIGFLSNM